MQLDRLLSASKTSPAETRSYNSGRYTQGISDLSKVYLPELLEHVSAGEVLETDSNLSSCINFTV